MSYYTGSSVIMQGKPLFKPGDCPDRGTIAAGKLQRKAAEPEQVIAALLQICQIFDVDNVFFPEELPVPGQIVHRIDADGVDTDPLVVSGKDEVQNRERTASF